MDKVTESPIIQTMFPEADEELVKRFMSFHLENPKIFQEFKRLAVFIKDSGHRRYSGWVIINLIRWNADIKSKGEPFKINNDFVALYCRMLIFEEPRFAGFFQFRTMKSNNRRMSGEQSKRVAA